MTTLQLQHEAKYIQRTQSTFHAAKYLREHKAPLWLARYILLYTR
jgi:hypothetical protein